MWELRFYFPDNISESITLTEPQQAREKIGEFFISGLREIQKNGITTFYPSREIKKIQLKQVEIK